MKKYFYKLLVKYFSFYIRPSDSFIDVNPSNDFVYKNLQARERGISNISAAPKNTTSNEVISETSPVKNPDYIILNGNIHYERDIQSFLAALHDRCKPETRILVTYYSSLWKPLLTLASFLKIRRKTPEKNWIAHEDMEKKSSSNSTN